MKQMADDVDIRIKNFMTKKLAQYPELETKKSVKVSNDQRGYFFDSILIHFQLRHTKAQW